MKVENFEKKAILLLCSDAIANSTLHEAINSPTKISCKFTGAGYYLDIEHKDLPSDRIVCDSPSVLGTFQDNIKVGFIVFIENNTLCLECYGYGSEGVPPEIRDGLVSITSE